MCGLRDRVDTSLAGLRHLANRLEEESNAEVSTDVPLRVHEKNNKTKKKQKTSHKAVIFKIGSKVPEILFSLQIKCVAGQILIYTTKCLILFFKFLSKQDQRFIAGPKLGG